MLHDMCVQPKYTLLDNDQEELEALVHSIICLHLFKLMYINDQ